MFEKGDGVICANQVEAFLRVLRGFIVKVQAVVFVEFLVKGDVVIAYGMLVSSHLASIEKNGWHTRNHDLDLKVCLLDPVEGRLQLSKGALLCQVACMN